jgi:hypothetical protein
VSATPFRPDEFSPLERAALACWRAPAPPASFAERVLARAATEAAPAPPRGRLGVAAFALIVLGGLLSVRSMMEGASGMPGQERASGFPAHDAGLRPEVNEDVSEDVSEGISEDVREDGRQLDRLGQSS